MSQGIRISGYQDISCVTDLLISCFADNLTMGLSVNGKPPVSKTGTPRSSRGRPAMEPCGSWPDLIRV